MKDGSILGIVVIHDGDRYETGHCSLDPDFGHGLNGSSLQQEDA